MSWSSIVGQERVKALLRRTLQSGHIAHAYLFYGPEGIGKDALAIEFAKTLLCAEGSPDACGVCPNCQRMNVGNVPGASNGKFDGHFIFSNS